MTLLTKKQRQQVRDKSGGRCWYCGNPLPEKGWHTDHFEPVFRPLPSKPAKTKSGFGEIPELVRKLIGNGGMANPENDHINNMVPACAPCNLFKSVWSIEAFRREIELQAERARKSSVNFRTAERFGIVQVVNEPVVFWFEKQGLSVA